MPPPPPAPPSGGVALTVPLPPVAVAVLAPPAPFTPPPTPPLKDCAMLLPINKNDSAAIELRDEIVLQTFIWYRLFDGLSAIWNMGLMPIYIFVVTVVSGLTQLLEIIFELHKQLTIR
jgi:hypothetical protein